MEKKQQINRGRGGEENREEKIDVKRRGKEKEIEGKQQENGGRGKEETREQKKKEVKRGKKRCIFM